MYMYNEYEIEIIGFDQHPLKGRMTSFYGLCPPFEINYLCQLTMFAFGYYLVARLAKV